MLLNEFTEGIPIPAGADPLTEVIEALWGHRDL
jgi:hypothetical protein